MAFFCFLVALMMMMAFVASPLVAALSADELSTETPSISAAPAVSPDSPLSPDTELSPDIAPLLPSPSGVVPTIPSNPSTNPDETSFNGPDQSAMAPSGSLPASSAVCDHSSLKSVKLLAMVFAVLLWFQ